MKPQLESISNYLGQDSSPFLKPPQFTKLSDFDTADMDQLRIELLRISPSFAFFDDLAGLKSKRISKKDRFLRLYLEAANATTPSRGFKSTRSQEAINANKNQLLETYDSISRTRKEYGCIHRPLIEWYEEVGRHLFDNWTNRPGLKFFGALNFEYDGNATNSEIRSKVVTYIDAATSDEHWPPTLLMALRTDMPKPMARKHLMTVLDLYYDFLIQPSDTQYRKRKQLVGKRERPDSISRKLKVLICKAFQPDMPLWMIGLKAGLSYKHLEAFLDKTKTKSDLSISRTTLAALTNRAIRSGQYIAEHASVDSFPNDRAVLTPDYDWDLVKQRILLAHPHLQVADSYTQEELRENYLNYK
jgi:hypothetical protein